MTFYQSQWGFGDNLEFGELRYTPEECYHDLIQMGYDVARLSSKTQFPSSCEVHGIGIAIVKV